MTPRKQAKADTRRKKVKKKLNMQRNNKPATKKKK